MPLSIVRSVAAFAALAALAAVTPACTAETEPSAEDTSEVDEALSESATYYRLERKNSDGTYVVSRANGGSFRCPNGAKGSRCTVDELVLPADCDWECTDG